LLGYAIPVLTALLILPVFYQIFRVSGWFSGISQAFLAVAIFALVREAITRRVWNRLADQLNVDSAELDFVTAHTL
jgi:hypothetical protein